jgi:hypothetical protein
MWKKLSILFTKSLCACLILACVVTVASCDLLFGTNPPPKLILKNNSSEPITIIEFWESTDEYNKAGAELYLAEMKWFLDPYNPETIAAFGKATLKCLEAQQKILISPPKISDENPLAPGDSRSWELDKHIALLRVNGDSVAKDVDLVDKDVTLIFTDYDWE